MLNALRDFLYRFQQPSNLNKLAGLVGYCLVPLTTDIMAKNGVAVAGSTYHVYPLDNFVKYDPCAVVGVKDGYLMVVKPFKFRIESVDNISAGTITISAGTVVVSEIATIRELFWLHRSVFQNPSFEQDFTGWDVVIGATIVEGIAYTGNKSAFFRVNTTDRITQSLPVPLDVDCLSSFYCYLFTPVTFGIALRVRYYYTDETNSSQTLTTAQTVNWEKHVLTPTAGKILQKIEFGELPPNTRNVYLDSLFTVF